MLQRFDSGPPKSPRKRKPSSKPLRRKDGMFQPHIRAGFDPSTAHPDDRELAELIILHGTTELS